MKRKFTSALALVIFSIALVVVSYVPEKTTDTTSSNLKTGMAISVSLGDSKDATEEKEGTNTTNITVAAVTVDENGKVLQETEVSYGEIPVYNGRVPTKATTAEYIYTFSGWDKEIIEVDGDVTYTATFTQEPNNTHYHDFTGDWQKDNDYHWKDCECGEHNTKESHNFTSIVIKEATSEEEGLEEFKCTVCGHKYTKTIAKKSSSENNNGCGGSNGCGGNISSTIITAIGLLGTAIFIARRKKYN